MIALFTHPVVLPTAAALWLVLPLCLAVAITYKAVRTRRLRRLPLEVGLLMGLMLVGLTALGVGLALVVKYWPA